MASIIEIIKEIPPLPKTVIDTLSLSTKQNKTTEDLVAIIKDDSLTIVMLLKTANSAIFGFRNRVETVENLIYLLGMDFTISLILSNNMQNNFDVDFSPYGINSNDFRKNTSLKLTILHYWINRTDNELSKKLYLPIVLCDLGKYIIATSILKIKQKDEFLKDALDNLNNISKIEKKYCSMSSMEITISLLEHWKLNPRIIDTLIHTLKGYDSEESNIISIINTISNIMMPLDKIEIGKALKKAKEKNLHSNLLKDALEKIEDYLLEE